MNNALVYHGTPLTPRAALEAVMPSRAGCVSFYKPQDLEALLAICPQLMFRSRRVQLLDDGNARRAGVGSGEPGCVVGRLLCLVGVNHLGSRPLGNRAGQSRRAVAGQRWTVERLAVRPVEGRAGLAHGRTGRTAGSPVRAVRPCLSRLDWAPQARACGLRRLSAEDGSGGGVNGQHLAFATHVARHSGKGLVPVY